MRTITAQIPATKIGVIHRNVAALNKRAATLRADGRFTASFGDKYVIKIENAEGRKIPVNVVDVEITGPDFSVGGFDLVCFAKLDADRVYVDYNAEGFEGYADITTSCDHCNQSRARVNMYILRNQETGAYIQVGKTCVKDFLGHSVTDALSGAGFWAQLRDEMDDFMRGAMADMGIPVTEIVTLAAAVIERDGYINRVTAEEEMREATADTVRDLLSRNVNIAEEKHEAIAEAVIAWANDKFIGNTESSFAANVGAALEAGFVTPRMVGFLACLPALKSRDDERREIAKQGADSEHFGTPKQRLEGNFEVVAEHSFEGHYGVTHLYTMIVDGNVAKWFSSTGGMEVGDKGRAKMTIKKHDEYKGVKQTIVNRVTVL